MLIFMFIAIVFVRTVVSEKEVFQEECDKIYRVLKAEFSDDFVRWDVELLQDSTIRFRNPEVLFLVGSDEIRPNFQNILSNFLPRYMESIQPFLEDIREIRIEGHTSSEYGDESPDRAYFLNMELSQSRTRAILRYALELPGVSSYAEWARPLITANGLSSSKLIPLPGGQEDRIRSRRVEFRLLTSSCQKAGMYENQN
ncbi:MAG: OmpA family protein [Alphaproteobacteria bacterium]|nr:OmpA family protein [Alphaproteobacteria bacterium]